MRFIFIVLVAAFTSLSSQVEDTPYIYYHSEALNTIVIERADGTDSRAIGRDLMPVDHEFVSGPGWSPSGKWLAWTSAYSTEYSPGPERIWVVSADGNTRVTLLDSIENVVHASWSPTGDFLLIIELKPDDSTSVSLVDVTHQRTVAAFDDIVIGLGGRPNFWSADGKSVQIGYPEIRFVYIDGSIEDNVPAELRAPLALLHEAKSFPPETVSPDGSYEFKSEYPFTNNIHNLETGEIITLHPFGGGAGGICHFEWHPDAAWIFVTFNMTWAGGSCSWAGIRIIQANGNLQRELGPCNLGSRCADWLPERVLKHLSPGQLTSIVPDPILTIEHDGWVKGVGWHPDGLHLATYTETLNVDRSYTYAINIWDTKTTPPKLSQTYPVEICADASFAECKIMWSREQTRIGLTGISGTQIIDMANNEIVVVSDDYLVMFDETDTPIMVENATTIDYKADEQLIARADIQSHSIEIYPLEDSEIIYALVPDEEAYRFIYSATFIPDSAYIAFVGNPDEPVQGNFLWNLHDNSVEILPKYALEFLTNMDAFDAETIIGYGRGSLLYFWDVETRSVAARLNRYVTSVDVTSNLSRMATGSGYVAEVWNYRTIIDDLAGH